jgi:hypothetical protein
MPPESLHSSIISLPVSVPCAVVAEATQLMAESSFEHIKGWHCVICDFQEGRIFHVKDIRTKAKGENEESAVITFKY